MKKTLAIAIACGTLLLGCGDPLWDTRHWAQQDKKSCSKSAKHDAKDYAKAAPDYVAAGAPLPTRDTLVRGTDPFKHYGAYGYLVFTSRPSEEQESRYQKACEAYTLGAEHVDEYENVPPKELMVTFWLLMESPAGDGDDCANLIEKYDYATAKRIARTVDKVAVKGPLLVAWDRPFGSHDRGAPPLVFDLSTFSTEDLGRAMGIWYGRISRMPEAWRRGWRLAVFREEFRNLLQKYGEKVVEIVS